MSEIDRLITPEFIGRTADSAFTSENERAFCKRVWSTDPEIYQTRLKAIGFKGFGRVLDAGSGMGQWTLALARLNGKVDAIEISEERITFTKAVFQKCNSDTGIVQGSIEKMNYTDESFDAVFCYSVLLCTDYKASLREFYRVLKPGGKLYFNTNGLGWYLYNLIDGHNATSDFDPRKMAAETISNTLEYLSSGQHESGKSLVMPAHSTLQFCEEIGFEINASGGEGTLNPGGVENLRSFFKASYHDYEGVYEVLCTKKQRC